VTTKKTAKPTAKPVQAPKPYEPHVEVRAAGFFVVPFADVYIDGELREREKPLREIRPLNKGQLIEYAATLYDSQWEEFEREYKAQLQKGLAALQNGAGEG
jgi:hypothetical protein